MAGIDVSAMADTAWMFALAAMFVASLRAWMRLPEDSLAPMLWTPDGTPAMVAGRDLAVLFTPIAALIGGLLLAAAERLAGPDAPHGLVLVRFAAPVFLVFAHRAHLKAAVESVAAEA